MERAQPIITAPRIDTDRLILRAHRAADWPACIDLWSDPVVKKYLLGNETSSASDTWSRMLRYGGLWALLGYGYWAIEERTSARLVGEIGFADFKRAVDPPLGGTPEAGWVLTSDVHGRGYATEALRAMCAWGDTHLAGDATCCLIVPGNAASIRVAVKAGYRFARTVAFRGSASSVYTRDRNAAPWSKPPGKRARLTNSPSGHIVNRRS